MKIKSITVPLSYLGLLGLIISGYLIFYTQTIWKIILIFLGFSILFITLNTVVDDKIKQNQRIINFQIEIEGK